MAANFNFKQYFRVLNKIFSLKLWNALSLLNVSLSVVDYLDISKEPSSNKQFIVLNALMIKRLNVNEAAISFHLYCMHRTWMKRSSNYPVSGVSMRQWSYKLIHWCSASRTPPSWHSTAHVCWLKVLSKASTCASSWSWYSILPLSLLHMLNFCALCKYVVLLSTNKILIIIISVVKWF